METIAVAVAVVGFVGFPLWAFRIYEAHVSRKVIEAVRKQRVEYERQRALRWLAAASRSRGGEGSSGLEISTRPDAEKEEAQQSQSRQEAQAAAEAV